MDQQLACATFATVIPVLVIGVYLTSSRIRWAQATGWQYFVAMDLAVLTVTELASIYGVVHPSHQWVTWGAFGAGLGTLALASAITFDLTFPHGPPGQPHPGTGTEHPDGETDKQT